MSIKNEKRAMSKRELINEISEVTQLKPEIVRSVLNAFTDIFIREVVINGAFHFANCFTVKTHTKKARKQYNVNKEEYQYYPETKYLGITLSKKIKGFFRWKQRYEYNAKHGLTVEDWKNRKGSELPKSNINE